MPRLEQIYTDCVAKPAAACSSSRDALYRLAPGRDPPQIISSSPANQAVEIHRKSTLVEVGEMVPSPESLVVELIFEGPVRARWCEW